MQAQIITRDQFSYAQEKPMSYDVVEIKAGDETFYLDVDSPELKSLEPLLDYV